MPFRQIRKTVSNKIKKEIKTMARERMVTRTVSEAEVEVMTVEVSTQKVENKKFKISATIPTEKVLKYIKKTFETDELKIVAIINTTYTEILYGMTEQEFIQNAKILPPRFAEKETEEKAKS